MNRPAADNPLDRDALLDLIGQLCNGTISASHGETLDRMLCQHAAARAVYTDYMSMHGSLFGDAGDLARTATAVPTPAGDLPSEPGHSQPRVNLPAGRTNTRSGGARTTGRWLGLAASFALVAFGSSWFTRSWFADADRAAVAQLAPHDVEPDSAGASVATVTGTRDTRWAGNRSVGFGSELASGEKLTLLEGWAEITFDSGVRMLLTGPASFRVPEAGHAELLAGRVAATFPTETNGFQLSTPRLTVTGGETQFGLVATPNGGSEVHVFEGSVSAELLGPAGQRVQQVSLDGSRAAVAAPAAEALSYAAADETQFVRSLAPRTGPDGGLLAVEEFDYPVGPLAWQNGGFGWAGPWESTSVDERVARGPSPGGNGVARGSLPADNAPTYGNRALLSGQNNRVRRVLSTSLGGVFDAAGLVEDDDGMRLIGREGTRVYLSFTQRVSQLNDVFYGIELNRGDGNFNRVLCIGSGVDQTGYGVTSSFNKHLAGVCESLGEENTGGNFFVVRIDYGADHQDTATVYRNPASLDVEKDCEPTVVLNGNFAFDRISFGNFLGSKTHEVDEIRIGESYRAVTVERGRLNSNLAIRMANYDRPLRDVTGAKLMISAALIRM